MTKPGDFPDVEEVLIALCAPHGHACTLIPQTPEALEAAMPVIWISRNGGACDGITDRPVVEISVLARTRAESWLVAANIRDTIFNSPGTAPAGGLIDSAREITGVSQMPDLDPQNRLVTASYALSLRRRR